MSRKKPLHVSDYTQFMVDQIPYFDEAILEDIRPTDGWMLHVDSRKPIPIGFLFRFWWVVRCCWTLALWLFRPTWLDIAIPEKQPDPPRFTDVYPNTPKAWTKVKARKRRKSKPRKK